jgi:hypothetical protein
MPDKAQDHLLRHLKLHKFLAAIVIDTDSLDRKGSGFPDS